MEIVYERIAAIDVAREEVTVTPGFPGLLRGSFIHPGDRRDPGADPLPHDIIDVDQSDLAGFGGRAGREGAERLDRGADLPHVLGAPVTVGQVGLNALAPPGRQDAVEQVGDQVDQLPGARSTGGPASAGSTTGRARRTDTTSRTPTSSAAPVSSQPVRGTPCSRPSQPSARANGRNSTQDAVPAPDDTPARIVEGTASCSSRPA